MNMRFPLLAIAAISVCIGSSARLSAQDELKEKPKERPTKIAVLNLKDVFSDYTRARTLRDDLEKAAKPYQDKASKLRGEIKGYEVEVGKPGVDPTTKHKYEDAIRKCKFELEEVTVEFKRKITRKHEENVETIWKEVSVGVNAIAKAYEFHLVLPHGEPEYIGPSLERPRPILGEVFIGSRIIIEADFERTTKRDIRAPLYIHGSVDLTPIVVTTLNKWVSDGKKQPEESTWGQGTLFKQR